MNKLHIPALLMILAAVLSACAGNPAPSAAAPEIQYVVVTATPPPATNTPDPCAAQNIEAEVQKVHAFMRQFDDASTLAASRPREGLADSIASLQEIRRGAEDQPTPLCLSALKTYQVSHMNAVINTLVAFMGGADQASVDQGIAFARQEHDRYTLELARLLGLTVEPASSIATPAETSTPSP